MVANQNGVAIAAELLSGLNRWTFWLLGLPCTDNNMNNLKNNTKRVPRQLARRKPVRSCEQISIELYSQVFHLYPIRLDKVLSVTDGDTTRTYTYHVVGQLASATVGGGHRPPRDRVRPPGGRPLPQTETFLWDGLALVRRNDEHFINEPHVGNAPKKLRFEGKPRAQRSARRARKGPRGNPVVSSKGVSYFNDMLGTTLGKKEKSGKYSAAALLAFGEDISGSSSRSFSDPLAFDETVGIPFEIGFPYMYSHAWDKSYSWKGEYALE